MLQDVDADIIVAGAKRVALFCPTSRRRYFLPMQKKRLIGEEGKPHFLIFTDMDSEHSHQFYVAGVSYVQSTGSCRFCQMYVRRAYRVPISKSVTVRQAPRDFPIRKKWLQNIKALRLPASASSVVRRVE